MVIRVAPKKQQEFKEKTCLELLGVIRDRSYSSDKILCIEIGGTRIKAALLREINSIDQLKIVKTYAVLSEPYLNAKLPE